MEQNIAHRLAAVLAERFGELIEVPSDLPGLPELLSMASHATVRQWADKPVPDNLMRLLAACALSAPSKSDLQQADIIEVREAGRREALAALVPQMPWVRTAPAFLVFCGNGRRFRRLFARAGQPFTNEHLDGFFNPTVDAALVMMNFMRAASDVGLGCCPISVLRNEASRVSAILAMPDHVFPVAGLCVGYPGVAPRISTRLPLSMSLHVDRFDDEPFDDRMREHDARWLARRAERAATENAPAPPSAGWSAEKVRQYAHAQRADWGAFVRGKGFGLD